MKPLPDLNDEAAMLLRGKRSALGAAHSDAITALRDAYTALQSCDWSEIQPHAEAARDAANRLIVIASAWEELKQ